MKISCIFELFLVESSRPEFGIKTIYEVNKEAYRFSLIKRSVNFHDIYTWSDNATNEDKKQFLDLLNTDEMVDEINDLKNRFLITCKKKSKSTKVRI